MTKIGFLMALRDRLAGLPQAELEERLGFYSEMIEDRMEEGLSEEEAVAAVGSVDEIAAAVTAEMPLIKRAAEKIKPKRALRRWELVLLILGSPVWFSLLVAAFAVAISLYASLWAVLISLWAGFVALAVCAPAGVAVGVMLLCFGRIGAGIALLGGACTAAALSVLFCGGCLVLTRLSLALSCRIFGKRSNFATHGCHKSKKWLIAAIALLLLGCLLFGGGMTMLKGDFSMFSFSQYETNEHEIREDFTGISLSTDSADVRFLPAADGVCRVVCHERTSARHTATVEDGVLTVSLADRRAWYEYILNIGHDTVTVYLPESEYAALTVNIKTGSVELPSALCFASAEITASTGEVSSRASVTGLLKIKTSTGGITLEDTTVGALELAVSTGRISVKRVTCAGAVGLRVSTGKASLTALTCTELRSEGNTGDITLTDTLVSGSMHIKRSTGDVKLERADAGEIFVETDTGDVTGSLLSGKDFDTDTHTGKNEVPRGTAGGRCEIRTDTGDICITLCE